MSRGTGITRSKRSKINKEAKIELSIVFVIGDRKRIAKINKEIEIDAEIENIQLGTL